MRNPFAASRWTRLLGGMVMIPEPTVKPETILKHSKLALNHMTIYIYIGSVLISVTWKITCV